MTTQFPEQDGQSMNENHAVESLQWLAEQPQGFVPQPVVLSNQPEPEEAFFYFEDEPLDLDGSSFVAPFQVSHAMPSGIRTGAAIRSGIRNSC